MTRQLKIDRNVYFLGYDERASEYLSAFDVGMVSSRSESFSNTLLEYINAGLPVVSTAIGGSKELIRPGVNGYIVPHNNPRKMGDAVVKILKGERPEQEINKRILIEYSEESVTKKYEEVFSKITKTSQ
jgi:glycosyltransferase involved in cell wall biosynthesis